MSTMTLTDSQAARTQTASARSVSASQSGVHVKENFELVLQAGLDDVFKRKYAMPREGEQFFRTRTTDKQVIKFQSHFGLGLVSQNRDADTLPYDEKGLGFAYEISTNVFRGATAIERELQELELYGTINDIQSELATAAIDTIELVQADVFNRALGTSGAPIICEDGMYLIDSDRPNAYAPAGTWSNLEATSAITATSLYTAQLNFAYRRSERDKLSPLTLKKIIIRPADEKVLWELLKSDLRPTDAMHARNYFQGRFEYSVYNHLTSAYIFYLAGDPKSSENELQYVTRKQPEVMTWVGDNPDIIKQRIRFAVGVGCGRPYIWAGGIVS